MKRTSWWKKMLAIGALSGAVLFQTPACTDAAQIITAGASVVTAGGVMYLVDRVIRD